jgi:hypothetical protein
MMKEQGGVADAAGMQFASLERVVRCRGRLAAPGSSG